MDLGFIGKISASIDGKGRVAIPAKYRKRLKDVDDDAGTVVVTFSEADRCLWLYPVSEWSDIRARIRTLPTTNARNRMLRQKLLGGATDLDIDSNGRILLPAEHREYIGVDKQILFVGNDQKIELWEESEWKAQMERAEQYSLEEDTDEAGSLERDQLVL